MEQFAIGANFKSAAARRNERERFNAFAEFKNLGRQTDGLGRVVSNHAVFDRYFRLHVTRSFPSETYRRGETRSRLRRYPPSLRLRRDKQTTAREDVDPFGLARASLRR